MRSGPGAPGKAYTPKVPIAIFLLFRGELPNIKRPAHEADSRVRTQPAVSHRTAALARRHGVGAAGRGRKRTGSGRRAEALEGHRWAWTPSGSIASPSWTRNGNIIETWTQWDKIFKRPHFVTINPYDPEKHVWVVDDHMHAIYKFTHDGKTAGADHRHANGEGRGRHALQPSDVPRLAAGQHHVRRRRLQRHARRQVRQGRQIPDGLGHEGHAAE